jgi:galactokinase
MHDDALERLRRIGMSAGEAAVKAAAVVRADRALDALGAGKRRWSAWVPGRIEIFGKHTDYAGGRSLLCAAERGFVVRAAARPDQVVRAVDVTSGTSHLTAVHQSHAPDERVGWGVYIDTVARRVARNFRGADRGVDMAFLSDLPIAAGMSSSSALLTAAFLVIAQANDLREAPEYRRVIASTEDLAEYLGCVENGRACGTLSGDAGVGTFGGSEDHVAMLCTEAGWALQYGFSPVRREGAYRVPADHEFVIAASGVTAEKTGGARAQYNRLSQIARHLLDAWNDATGRADASLADAARSGPDAAERLRTIAAHAVSSPFESPTLVRRLDQFLLESFEIVPASGPALEAGDWTTLGTLATRSQRAAENDLGNQVPETMALARSARAASAFGAGFGGSVWALVPDRDAADFAARWSAGYSREFPGAASRAAFFRSRAGPSAHVW